MRLVFIRHGDPDYVNDTLTPKGRREAELLARWLKDKRIDAVYQSPLGRARDTARYVLDAKGMEAETLPWLQEFQARFDPNLSADARIAYSNELKTDPATGKFQKRILWDILPSYYAAHPALFASDQWKQTELVRCSDMAERYDEAVREFDGLLSRHGYERDGSIYRVRAGNDQVIAFFCHFAISAVLLSHLWNVSPFVPLQFLSAAPTSVTEVATEEREQGIACFRTLRYGDITHLNLGGEPASFSARFCERYENLDERH